MPRPNATAALVAHAALVGGALLGLATGSAAQAETPVRVHDVDGWTVPGYYQFFHKAGDQVRIDPEIRRDEQIAAGQIAPEPFDAELPDLSLPDARGTLHSLRDMADGRRLVIVNVRAWW